VALFRVLQHDVDCSSNRRDCNAVDRRRHTRSIMGRRVEAARKRKALAEKLLGPAVTRCKLPTYHLWLPLPEPWRVDQFINHAAAVTVSLVSTDLFVPGRAATPQAIRICTGTEPSLDRVETGIRTLARMLKSGPAGYSVLGV
jgi:DNA-binding transcriptional MocR family regulator